MTVDAFLEIIIYLSFSTFSVSYLLSILLFNPYDGGPFTRNDFVVTSRLDENMNHSRVMGLWDYVRLLFRAYDREDNTFRLKNNVWLCPYCLGFWLVFSVSWYFWFLFDMSDLNKLFFTIIAHLSVSWLSARLVEYEN